MKEFKIPCCVSSKELDDEKADKLREAFIKLGCEYVEPRYTDWDWFGVSYYNAAVNWVNQCFFSRNKDESEVTEYSYEEVIEMAGMSEEVEYSCVPADPISALVEAPVSVKTEVNITLTIKGHNVNLTREELVGLHKKICEVESELNGFSLR